MEKIIKIGLATLFIIGIFSLPYGYYMFLRLCATIGFAYLAFKAYSEKQNISMVVYGALVVLFQPLFMITLDKEAWVIIDIIIAIYLMISLLIKKSTTE